MHRVSTSPPPREGSLTRARLRCQRLADIDEVVLGGPCPGDSFPVVTVPRQGREVVVVASRVSAGKRSPPSSSRAF